MAEAWRLSLYPERFRSYEPRMRVLGPTAGILGELEVAVRRELGADRSPLDRGPGDDTGLLGQAAKRFRAPRPPPIEATREVHLHLHGVTAEDMAAILRQQYPSG